VSTHDLSTARKCAWCHGDPIIHCVICQAKPSSPETYADEAVHPVPAGECRCECSACEYRGEHHADAGGGPCQIDLADIAIRTLEYEAGVRDQELADLRLRVVQLESAAGFVVRRAELATSTSLRERIEALRKVLDSEDASTLSRGDGFRHFANELIDAIATPTGRDFRHAWDEACLFFGRFGAEPTLFAPLLKLAEATRLYVADDDEDRVETWDAMVMALDEALEALPEPPSALIGDGAPRHRVTTANEGSNGR